jgi:hypothetical protein
VQGARGKSQSSQGQKGGQGAEGGVEGVTARGRACRVRQRGSAEARAHSTAQHGAMACKPACQEAPNRHSLALLPSPTAGGG